MKTKASNFRLGNAILLLIDEYRGELTRTAFLKNAVFEKVQKIEKLTPKQEKSIYKGFLEAKLRKGQYLN